MDLVKALGDQRKADAEAEQATDGDDPQAVIGAMSAQANAGEATQDEGPIANGLYIDSELQDDGTEHPGLVRPQRPKDIVEIAPGESITTIPVRRRQNRDGLEYRL